VAHRVLDADEVDAAGDEQRSEGVAEVVPVERAQTGSVAGPLVAMAQRGAVEQSAVRMAENVVVGERKCARCAWPAERFGDLVGPGDAPSRFRRAA
jgi:hypothetical protein